MIFISCIVLFSVLAHNGVLRGDEACAWCFCSYFVARYVWITFWEHV